MTKDDYMKLSKERLAELLAEKDARDELYKGIFQLSPIEVNSKPLCYEPGGVCTNPHMDCINCPRKYTGGTFVTNTEYNTGK